MSDRQLALQRGFQALEDELGDFGRRAELQRGFQALEDDIGRLGRSFRASRAGRRPRNRPRVRGSWRDQGKGDCFTRTNASGGRYVVCEGSRGQSGVYQPRGSREDRGDPDMKGRDKTEAIRDNRTVVRKYDDEGRINQEVGTQNYFIPIGEENGIVYLQQGINTRGDVFGGSAFADLSDFNKADLIAVPKDKFNAQYRVHRGIENPRDKYDGLLANRYELANYNEREQSLRLNAIVPSFRERRNVEELIGETRAAGGGRAGLRQAVSARRQRRRRQEFREALGRTERDPRVLTQLGLDPDADFFERLIFRENLDRARRIRRGEEEEEEEEEE